MRVRVNPHNRLAVNAKRTNVQRYDVTLAAGNPILDACAATRLCVSHGRINPTCRMYDCISCQ